MQTYAVILLATIGSTLSEYTLSSLEKHAIGCIAETIREAAGVDADYSAQFRGMLQIIVSSSEFKPQRDDIQYMQTYWNNQKQKYIIQKDEDHYDVSMLMTPQGKAAATKVVCDDEGLFFKLEIRKDKQTTTIVTKMAQNFADCAKVVDRIKVFLKMKCTGGTTELLWCTKKLLTNLCGRGTFSSFGALITAAMPTSAICTCETN